MEGSGICQEFRSQKNTKGRTSPLARSIDVDLDEKTSELRQGVDQSINQPIGKGIVGLHLDPNSATAIDVNIDILDQMSQLTLNHPLDVAFQGLAIHWRDGGDDGTWLGNHGTVHRDDNGNRDHDGLKGAPGQRGRSRLWRERSGREEGIGSENTVATRNESEGERCQAEPTHGCLREQGR
jgi:hypothetical protein